MSWKCFVARGLLWSSLLLGSMACKKGSKEPSLPNSGEMVQSMHAREKALSSFSLQVHTEEAGWEVEHTLLFRTPHFVRADMTQPRKLSVSFDGHKYYRLEEAAKELHIVNLSFPTAERRLAMSLLVGDFVPEGFQLPKVVPSGLKQSWLEPLGQSRILRLENRINDAGETARIAYVVRWPSLDFLKKEILLEGQPPLEFVMQEEQCIAEHKLCLPTRIMARQEGAPLAPQKIKLLSFGEAVRNELFVLEPPEGFAVKQHNIASLKELESFLQGGEAGSK